MLTLTPRRTVYSSPQACRLAGVSYRQLDYWVRVGLIEPSLGHARGSGTSRRWSVADILGLRVVSELMERGVGHQAIRQAVSLLADAGSYLWVSGDAVATGSFVDLVPALRSGAVVVLDLDGLRGSISSAA